MQKETKKEKEKKNNANAKECALADQISPSNGGGAVPILSHGCSTAKVPLYVVTLYRILASPMVAGILTCQLLHTSIGSSLQYNSALVGFHSPSSIHSTLIPVEFLVLIVNGLLSPETLNEGATQSSARPGSPSGTSWTLTSNG